MERSHGEEGVEGKTGKTKIMIYGTGLELLQSLGEYLCAVATAASTAMAANFGIRSAVGYNG